MKEINKTKFYNSIKSILSKARLKSYQSVNTAMVEAYWYIGQIIVEEEQAGEKRAEYGKYLIKNLSQKLVQEFGKGFSEQNLWNIKQFYLTFPKLSTVWRELSWSHYKLLIRVKNKKKREYYAIEAIQQNWSVRALDRQISSSYYERLLVSKNKKLVKKEAEKNTKFLGIKAEELIKDPYVLEFLNMHPDLTYLEKEIEQGLIDKLQQFFLELGKGFSFVERQKRISTETSEFYIDLVFYNYLLKCFILIDIKSGKLTHQDVGQMDMYVRIFEDKVKPKEDNPTIGLILCAEKDATIVKYSVLRGSKRLFASKYKFYLPTEQELIEELERERTIMGREKRAKNIKHNS